jgi:acyl-CoA thioesterase FadM
MSSTQPAMDIMGTPVPEPLVTVRDAYPSFEGSNIGAWMGFKHFMYLMEEAVVQHVRERWAGPRALYERHGLGLEIVDSSIRILTALHLDQLTRVEARPRCGRDEYELGIALSARDGDEWAPVATGTVKVLFRAAATGIEGLPAELRPYVRERIERDTRASMLTPSPAAGRGWTGRAEGSPQPPGVEANSFVWRWRIPYFYCHFMDRLQHSGYIRLMEEVVDLYLRDRGLSIRTLLEARSWIPVVTKAGVEILREARLEEEVHTVFTVRDVYKHLLYSATMECYVRRGAEWVQTAAGTIVHGYAHIPQRGVMRLVSLDAPVLAALTGERR